MYPDNPEQFMVIEDGDFQQKLKSLQKIRKCDKML